MREQKQNPVRNITHPDARLLSFALVLLCVLHRKFFHLRGNASGMQKSRGDCGTQSRKRSGETSFPALSAHPILTPYEA
jgi:hypothetical protein